MAPVRTRFAPSPTGDLHVGGAFVAVASWWLARRAGGAFVVRVEDLDRPRVVAGSAERILDDLRWLGLDWDEGPDVGGPFGPYAQSLRDGRYVERLRALDEAGLLYPCDCSRAEIARALSAPHEGEESIYPGLCRDKDRGRVGRRAFAWRVRVPEGSRAFTDLAAGPSSQDLARDVGDFVVRRGDGLFTYQLAVAADDLDMGITHVVRGADLLGSTLRQTYLMELWGGSGPSYVHLPLVVDAQGERLAKRTLGARVRGLREAGFQASAILGTLANALGLAPTTEPLSPRALAGLEGQGPWLSRSWRIPGGWTSR